MVNSSFLVDAYIYVCTDVYIYMNISFLSILKLSPSISSKEQKNRKISNFFYPLENEDLVVVCVILYMVTTPANQVNGNFWEGAGADNLLTG